MYTLSRLHSCGRLTVNECVTTNNSLSISFVSDNAKLVLNRYTLYILLLSKFQKLSCTHTHTYDTFKVKNK